MTAPALVFRRYSTAIAAHAAAAAKAVWSVRAEAAAVIALMTGWALLWLGMSIILARWIPPMGLLSIGAGVFLLSCFGWRMLRTIATVGLYALTRGDDA